MSSAQIVSVSAMNNRMISGTPGITGTAVPMHTMMPGNGVGKRCLGGEENEGRSHVVCHLILLDLNHDLLTLYWSFWSIVGYG